MPLGFGGTYPGTPVPNQTDQIVCLLIGISCAKHVIEFCVVKFLPGLPLLALPRAPAHIGGLVLAFPSPATV